MNKNDKMKVEFVYHHAFDWRTHLRLEVGENETVRDVKPRIVEELWGKQRNSELDICLSRGYTIIKDETTFPSKRDKPLVYVVHTLPSGNIKCVMLKHKEEDHLVIVPKNCSVVEFRVHVARVLQVPEGTLQLHDKKGGAESVESENSDFVQNPIKTEKYMLDMIQIWKQSMLKDSPHRLKHVYVKTCSSKVRCTVSVTVQNDTHMKSEHQFELFKYESFVSIQKHVAEKHKVDFRLVELLDNKGRSLHKPFVFKTTNKIDAIIWSKGKVVTVKTDDDEYICVIKDAEKMRVECVRRAIEQYHRMPNGAFKLAYGVSILPEDSFMSSILTSPSEKLVVHRNVWKEQTGMPQSPALDFSEPSCSPKDLLKTSPAQSKRKRTGRAGETNRQKKRKLSLKTSRTARSRFREFSSTERDETLDRVTEARRSEAASPSLIAPAGSHLAPPPQPDQPPPGLHVPAPQDLALATRPALDVLPYDPAPGQPRDDISAAFSGQPESRAPQDVSGDQREANGHPGTSSVVVRTSTTTVHQAEVRLSGQLTTEQQLRAVADIACARIAGPTPPQHTSLVPAIPRQSDALDKAFVRVAGTLGANDWHILSSRLGLSLKDLEDVSHQYPGNLTTQIRRGLDKWRQRMGSSANLQTFESALEASEFKDLAEQLRDIEAS